MAEQQSDDTETIDSQRILFPTPIGPLGIELSRRNKVTRVLIDPEDGERDSFTPFEELLDADESEFYEELFGQLSEYFAGARRDLDVEFDLDGAAVAGFDRRVLKEVARIPYGRTRTFQEIAAAAGNPEGYRQVLAVLVINPMPVVIPCHRVVTNKSGVGSYIAGKERKRWLLDLESENADTAQ